MPLYLDRIVCNETGVTTNHSECDAPHMLISEPITEDQFDYLINHYETQGWDIEFSTDQVDALIMARSAVESHLPNLGLQLLLTAGIGSVTAG